MSISIINIINNADPDDDECVILVVEEDINLGNYAIRDHTYDDDGDVSDIFPHYYEFPHKAVKKGEIIVLYTGTGKDGSYKNAEDTNVHAFYWGSDESIWNNSGDQAILLRIKYLQTYTIPDETEE